MDANLIDKYFLAWKAQASSSLDSVFLSTATYEISHKQVAYTGLEEIKGYWDKNARRQSAITLAYKTIRSDSESATVAFSARFFDREKGKWNSVGGMMEFHQPKGSIRIVRFTETYAKIEATPGWRYYIVSLIQKLNWLGVPKAWIIRQMRAVGNVALNVTIAAVVVAVVLFAGFGYLLHTQPTHRLIQAIITTTGDGATEGVVAARELFDLIAALGGGIGFPLAFLFWDRIRKSNEGLKVVNLAYKDHDLDLMARAFHGAESVVIFSGDFSFLKPNAHAGLHKTLERLVADRKVVFISDKSKEVVQLAMQGVPDGSVGLWSMANDSGLFKYASGLTIKLSLISYGMGSHQVLHRQREDDEKFVMVVVDSSRRTRYLLQCFGAIVLRLKEGLP